MNAIAEQPATIPLAKKVKSKAELLAHVSASRLTTFHQCRLKWFFRYVAGLDKPKSGALFVGTQVHSILQEWNRARWLKQVMTPDQLRVQFDKNWSEEQTSEPVDWEGEEEKQEKEGAWSLLKTYFDQTPIPPNERPEGVEVEVEADLSKHGLTKLVGIIDLVRAGGRIVDFKTSGQTPNPGRAIHLNETQLSCYAILYRDATGKREQGLELHHLVKLKSPKVVVTTVGPMLEYQQKKLFKLIESYLNGIAEEDFVPSPNTMSCACCEFYRECRSWS